MECQTPPLIESEMAMSTYDADETFEIFRAACWWMGTEVVRKREEQGKVNDSHDEL